MVAWREFLLELVTVQSDFNFRSIDNVLRRMSLLSSFCCLCGSFIIVHNAILGFILLVIISTVYFEVGYPASGI